MKSAGPNNRSAGTCSDLGVSPGTVVTKGEAGAWPGSRGGSFPDCWKMTPSTTTESQTVNVPVAVQVSVQQVTSVPSVQYRFGPTQVPPIR